MYCLKRTNNCFHFLRTAIALWLLFLSLSSNIVQAQSYKQNTGFLLQKIEPAKIDFYIPFKHGYVLLFLVGIISLPKRPLLTILPKTLSIIAEQ